MMRPLESTTRAKTTFGYRVHARPTDRKTGPQVGAGLDPISPTSANAECTGTGHPYPPL